MRVRRNGRRQYDEESKRAVAHRCVHEGVAIAVAAREAGVNVNLLRKWVARYQDKPASANTSAAFVPVALGNTIAPAGALSVMRLDSSSLVPNQ